MSHKIKTAIIDDMDMARATLKADLAEYCPEIDIIAEANSVVTGLKLLKKTELDLLFLDIELDDGIGFDILELLEDYSFKVIFTTASDEYAIQAFQVSAVDYLLKPIDPILLQAAVKKINNIAPYKKEQISILKDQLTQDSSKKIVLHTQEKIVSVDIDQIIRLESEGNYTYFFFTDGTKLLITRTLKEFEKILSHHKFIRTHQSHLVNPNQVKEFTKTEGGYLLMNDGSRVSVSVRKRTEVLKFLGMG